MMPASSPHPAAIPLEYECDYDSARRGSPATHELVELFRYRDLLHQLVVRNIRVRYKRSALGVVWSMLSPLLTTVVLSMVFLTIFRPVAPNYPVYLLCGLLIWNFFVQTTSIMAAEMIGGAELWKRIYTPRTIFSVATLATGLVHLLLALVPLVAIVLFFRMPIGAAWLIVPFAIVCVALFTLGIGLLLCVVSARFPDVVDLYQVVIGAWMYLTPVIYPRAIVPERFQWLLVLNPMTWFVEAFRQPIYDNAVPPLWLLAMSFTVGLLSAALGWWAFTKSADDLARRI
jgi:ABC-type polysaccharide/polyol phosphate export permease